MKEMMKNHCFLTPQVWTKPALLFGQAYLELAALTSSGWTHLQCQGMYQNPENATINSTICRPPSLPTLQNNSLASASSLSNSASTSVPVSLQHPKWNFKSTIALQTSNMLLHCTECAWDEVSLPREKTLMQSTSETSIWLETSKNWTMKSCT